jgi:DNA segregation ATPase FtsK/SpoIIIE, S-DNA-T family
MPEVVQLAKRKRRKRQSKKGWKQSIIYEISGIILFALTCIGMAKMGVVGRLIYQISRLFAGNWWSLILIGTFALSLYYIWYRKQPSFFARRLVGAYTLCFAILLFTHVKLFESLTDNGQWNDASVIRNTWEIYKGQITGSIPAQYLGGGMIGAVGFAFFFLLFGTTGAMFMAIILILIGVLLLTGRSLRDEMQRLINRVRAMGSSIFKKQKKGWNKIKENHRNKKLEAETVQEALAEQASITPEPLVTDIDPIIHDFNEKVDHKITPEQALSHPSETSHIEQKTKSAGGEGQAFQIRSEVENETYECPPIDLLNRPAQQSQSNEKQHIASNVKKLERTFESFGVKAKIKKVHLGPAVTKYEVYPDVGVKVSRIVSLSDDIALALAAKEIRIEAPIPGKSAVGIEVPNQEVAMVSLREVLESDTAQRDTTKLAICLGRDISGIPIMADLAKMPHLLVAGATGSGKSVCINGMIISILMRTKPHEVKLLMVDPKMVELNGYNGVPHLLTPVVTDPKKASQALKKVVDEMERRYELFSETGTRNLEGYNNLIRKHNDESGEKNPLMPYIVVIIDELADLMMVASKDVEDAITRLAQMARAAGIHLIIATQRPSVDVITGVIKANIPSRIAFSVSSQTDSRTILDSGGAEKLLGKGDMLYLPIGASKPTRIQGAFLSDEEVERVVDFVISQQKAQYQENMIPTDEPESAHESVDDDLFEDAVKLVVDMQTASVSMLQRRFRIGYTRAARLIDAMEARQIVGPYEGSRPREVLIAKLEEEKTS